MFSIEVTGGEGLDVLVRALEATGSGKLARAVVAESARALGEVVALQFGAGESPRGQAFQPLTCRSGIPLFNSGGLMRSAMPIAESIELTIRSDLPGSKVQQFGATIVPKKAKVLRFFVGGRAVFRKSVTIPARPFVPEDGTLPVRWENDIANVQFRLVPDALPSSP